MHRTIPGKVEPVDDHTCTVPLGTASLEHIAADLTTMHADYTVHGPSELLEHLRTAGWRLVAGRHPGQARDTGAGLPHRDR